MICAFGDYFEDDVQPPAAGMGNPECMSLTTCSAADLIIHKVFAGRDEIGGTWKAS